MAPSFFVSSVIKPAAITPVASFSAGSKRAHTFLPKLLERVAELGSVGEAAASLGVHEDLAWNSLVAANNLSDVPLISTRAKLPQPTPNAQQILGHERQLADAFIGFLDVSEGGGFRQFHQRDRLLHRLAERTSARNQFYCRVRLVRQEQVNAVVTLDLGGGDHLAAQITSRSAEQLQLFSGRECHALIDPAWVEVRAETPRENNRHQNCLRGRVVRCKDDPVDAEIAIELAGGRIVLATMTQAEMREKDIQPGKQVSAVIQSSQIILAVEYDVAAADPEKFPL